MIVPYLRGYGPTRFLSGDTVRNGQQSVVAVDIIALMDALKVEKATIGGYDRGARTADIIAALWPDRCKAVVSVSGYLIGNHESGKIPLPPNAELQWWYQYYFATDRGATGYAKYRHDFAKLIWRIASRSGISMTRRSIARPHPSTIRTTLRSSSTITAGGSAWPTANANMTIWKGGSPKLPGIAVPTITLEGDANGAPHPDHGAYARKFSGSTRTGPSRKASGTICPGSATGLCRGHHRRRRKLTVALQALDRMMLMPMSTARLSALIVLVLAVLLTVAEFGPAVLGLK